MSKSILISIQPQWVEKILKGEKTIEIRKTMPKCELPCKVYVYMTKKRNFFMANRKGEEIWFGDGLRYDKTEIVKFPKCDVQYWHLLGKVVAEFTLNKIENMVKHEKGKDFWNFIDSNYIQNLLKKSCLSMEQIVNYVGDNKDAYAWFIEDLKIYDKPKELSEFRKDLDCDDYPCNKGGKGSYCKYYYYDITEGCSACGIDFDGEHCIYKTIKRPPQSGVHPKSWCYVEESNYD